MERRAEVAGLLVGHDGAGVVVGREVLPDDLVQPTRIIPDRKIATGGTVAGSAQIEVLRPR